MFLSVNGAKHGQINGESQDDKHKNEIEVLAWSWGMQGKPSLGGGGATGKATIRELRITKRVDKASTALMVGVAHQRGDQGSGPDHSQGRQEHRSSTSKIKIEDGRVMSLDIEAGDDVEQPGAHREGQLLVQQDQHRVHAAGSRRQRAGEHELRGSVERRS